MLFSNLKFVLRSFLRVKFFTFCTIIGFGSGLAICTITTAFYLHEVSTDDQFSGRIKRILMTHPVTSNREPNTYHELSEQLRVNYPEIETVTHVYYRGYLDLVVELKKGKTSYKEKTALFCDKYFFEVFEFKFIEGEASSCLTNPNSIVLTTAYAKKFFGKQEVLNRTIEISGRQLTVTGLIEPAPGSNSHLNLGILISFSSLPVATKPLEYGGFTYIKIRETLSDVELEDKLNKNRSSLLSFKPANWPQDPFRIESLKDCYYNTNYPEHLSKIFNSRERSTLSSYLLVSAVLFAVATINFIIFYYSSVAANSKAIVIKKIFGISWFWAIGGFAIDAFITLLLSLIFAVMISVMILPLFNAWADSSIPRFFTLGPMVIIPMLGLIVLTSLLLGTIFYLLFYRPSATNLLKGRITSLSRPWLLKSLMVIQLVLAITLSMLFFLIKDQLFSIESYSVGFSKDNLIEIDLNSFDAETNPQFLKSEFLRNSNVRSACISFGGPLSGRWSRNINHNGVDSDFGYYQVDEDFINTVGIELVKGNGFDKLLSNDSSYLVVNETAATFFNLSENLDSIRNDLPIGGKIIGIYKDFHYSSLRNKIGPTFLLFVPYTKLGPFKGKLILRVNSLNGESIGQLQAIWKEITPNAPFEYTLLDEAYDQFYKDDQYEANLLSLAVAGIGFVSCFGIVGFTFFSAQRRTRELAIRRVLGATISSICIRWFREILISVGIALILAIPLALILFSRWASDFVYKQPISLIFIPLTLLFIIMVLVSSSFYNIWSAASRDPAVILRSD